MSEKRVHAETTSRQAYARNIPQALLSKTPFLLANRPKHGRAYAEGVVGWPCLQRCLKPNHPSDGNDDIPQESPPSVA
jgi:hypothetical protein